MLKKLFVIIFVFTTFVLATTPINTNVTRLYIANFDRAPDADGLKYWVEESGLFLEEIAMSFFEQPESIAKYPSGYTNEEFIKSIYQNLFNREPDTAGLAYWQNTLDQNLMPRSLFILAVTNGATGDDKKILDNKTKVGLAFASAGATNIDQAYTLMQNVTADETSTTALICNPDIEYCDDFYKDIKDTSSENNTTDAQEKEEVVVIVSVVPPTILDASGNVLENASSGAIVSRISILSRGDSNITAINLSGTGSTNFEVSVGGQVTLKTGATLDYDTNPSYNLSVVAVNGAGNSNTAELSILVTDVATDVPILDDFSKTIAENTTQGTKIGRLSITTSDSPVTSITLSGTGKEYFTVATNGDISLASAVDYEEKPSYSLTAIARNSAGVSNSANVAITITNIDDEVPVLTSFTKAILENTAINTLIGTIPLSKEGDSSITKVELTGTNNDKFSVDIDRKITLLSELDYDNQEKSYALKATATNDAGESEAVSVTLNVGNVAEEVPVLKIDHAFNVSATATANTTVGTVTTSGTTDDQNIVTSYTIKGGNTGTYFTISPTGVITTAKDLDASTSTTYTLEVSATNAAGESSSVDVGITVNP